MAFDESLSAKSAVVVTQSIARYGPVIFGPFEGAKAQLRAATERCVIDMETYELAAFVVQHGDVARADFRAVRFEKQSHAAVHEVLAIVARAYGVRRQSAAATAL